MAGESPPRIESPPRKRPCTHCGGLSGSQVPDWDLLLGRRELPDSSVLLLPDAPPGASEGVSLSVQALHKCAPRILQILEESEAKSPLSISVPLSLDELRCLVLMSNGGDLSDQDAVVVERLAEFLHKFGAEGEAWEPLRKFVKDLGVLVTAIRFNRWPELLPPLLCCLMAGIERDYADDGGGDQPADVSVLHLLLADSVDVPRALRLYIETVAEHSYRLMTADEPVILEAMAKHSNHAGWSDPRLCSVLELYFCREILTPLGKIDRAQMLQSQILEDMPTDGSAGYLALRNCLILRCIRGSVYADG